MADNQPAPNPIKLFKAEVKGWMVDIAPMLPSHIKPAKFANTVITAVNKVPALLRCDHRSLFNECMKAANDGLLPDGKEAVIIPYADDSERGRGDTARYIPMIEGIRKKVQRAGVLKDWYVRAIQEGDEWDYAWGDNPFIYHKPTKTGGRDRPIEAVYSIATYPDGTKSYELMTSEMIEEVARTVRSKKGPWSHPTWRVEMAKKTVAKLHAKQLPMSGDLVFTREDDMYQLEGDPREQKRVQQRPGSARQALEFFAAGPEEPEPAPPTKSKEPYIEPEPEPKQARKPAETKPTPPKNEDDYRTYAKALIDAATDATQLDEWFKSAEQRKMRNGAGVTREMFDHVHTLVKDKVHDLERENAA